MSGRLHKGPEQMKGYLRRLSIVGRSWILVLWIYLSAGCRFIGWRLQLWFRQPYSVESTYMGTKQTLLLIRHGQTEWNKEHRLPGKLPGISLNDIGKQQAARLADALSILPITAIISSPLERARETAEYIAQVKGLPVQLEPDLEDTDVGRWAGQIYEELNKTDPDWKAYVKDPSVAPEGVETFPQAQQRAMAAIERWRTQEPTGNYPAFVMHADIIKLIIAYYTGLDAGRAGTLFIDNASASLIEIEPESRPRVIAISWNPKPGWLTPPPVEHSKSEEQQEGEQKA
jgi:broad specificity phosphatase PhoE